MSEIELKLKSKSRKVWLTGILWMIVSGIIFYLILGFASVDKGPALSLTYLLLFFLTLVVLTFTGIVFKTLKLLWRNTLVFPFGIVIAIILNEIVKKWGYLEGNVVGFAIAHFILLFSLHLITCLFAIPFVRLCTGYEVASQFRGKVHSYVFSSQTSKDLPLLEELFSPFNISLSTYLSEKDYAVLGFDKGGNSFLVYYQRRNETLTEFDLIAYRVSKDILIEAENENLETFFAALDGIVAKWKEQGKVREPASRSNPMFVEQARNYLLTRYTNPIKFEIGFHRIKLYLSMMKGFPKNHPNAFSIGLVIVSALLGAIVTVIVTKLLGG